MRKRRKRPLAWGIICGLLLAATACGKYDIADEGTTAPQEVAPQEVAPQEVVPQEVVPQETAPQGTEEDPFAQSGEEGSLGAISHGETDPARGEDGSVLPYEYNGGEFALDYGFASEGKLDTIGFLLFLDGKPQAYRVDDTDEYEYLHCFRTSEQHEEDFSFVFTPSTGKKGDTLNITVVSITNPAFQPDMKETSSYGWYHRSLERTLQLHFNEDPPDGQGVCGETENIFRHVSVTEEKVTSSFIEEELGKNGWNGVTMDTLDNGIYPVISYDGQLVYDNIDLSHKDTLTVRYAICGRAGTRLGVTFFLNHKPISSDEVITYDGTLGKGNVWIIEAVIDVSKLSGFNTFYVAAIAAGDDDTMPANKTASILLYKED